MNRRPATRSLIAAIAGGIAVWLAGWLTHDPHAGAHGFFWACGGLTIAGVALGRRR